jgi:hypothetical protein
MGFQLHPIDEIVNVKWGGGKFVVVGTARDTTKEGPIGCFYSKDGNDWSSVRVDPGTPKPAAPMEEPGQQPRDEGLWANYLEAMVGGEIIEQSGDEETKKRIIVAGGFRSNMIGANFPNPDDPSSYHYNFQTTAILFWSDDGGQKWNKATNPVTADPDGAGSASQVQVFYLAFDPDKRTFYGDVAKSGSFVTGFTGHSYFERYLISSTDGKTWKIDQSSRHVDETATWTSAFITKIKNMHNNGLTEIVNTDADPEVKLIYKTIEVQPDIAGGQFKLAPPWRIERQPEDTDAPSFDVKGIKYGSQVTAGVKKIKGFAYAGGAFLIAGSLMMDDDGQNLQVIAYRSIDNGETWKKTLDDSKTFVTADPYSASGIGPAGSSGCGA